MLAILAQAEKTFFLPPARSTIAESHDGLYQFVLWMSVFWLVLIAGVMVYFVIKYRRKSPHDKPVGPTHSTAIELGWTLPPLILVMIIFVWGFRGFMDMNQAPNGANRNQVLVAASKWNWSFTYGGGQVDGTLHVPVNTPISLVLTSSDVIHSFYVPDFRVKKDVVPGRYNKTWFQATEAGTYNLFCAEYCGQQHSQMLTKVVVESQEDYDAYIENLDKILLTMPPVELGQRTYKVKGCKQCHSLDGTDGTGPSWKDVFGTTQTFTDGSTREVDENYVRDSILNPGKDIVAGYDNVMPTFQGTIKDQEITGVIELLKSISSNYDGVVLDKAPAEPGDKSSPGDQTQVQE
jgi:cytochrome c oxidase subunit II